MKNFNGVYFSRAAFGRFLFEYQGNVLYTNDSQLYDDFIELANDGWPQHYDDPFMTLMDRFSDPLQDERSFSNSPKKLGHESN